MYWPEALPQCLLIAGFSTAMDGSALRQDMDAGPAYQRPRYTAAVEPFSGSIMLTRDQYRIFQGFWRALGNGAARFEWMHPVTQEPATVQFDVSSPPSLSAQTGRLFQLSMNIEVIG